MNYALDFGHTQAALEAQHNFVYGLWFEHGVSLAIIALIALTVVIAAWDKIKWWWPRFKVSIRTWRMTPKRYEEWQREVVASGIVELFDSYVKSGVLSRAKSYQWQQSIGHLGFWDLVSRHSPPKPSHLDRMLQKEELKAKHKSNGNTFRATLAHSVEQAKENKGD